MRNFILAVLIVAASTSTFAANLSVSLSPKKVSNGQVSLLCVQAKSWPLNLTAQAGDRSIILIEAPKTRSRCGLVPVPLEFKSSSLEVTLSFEESGSSQTKKVSLEVGQGTYSESKLKVDPRITSPAPEDLKRIEREREELAAVYATASPTPLCREAFALPGKGAITSQFGNKRTFNGKVESWHQGVDLRAKKGDPVRAANAGKVIFAKELFLAGNTVIVDHGAGILSSYAHLSAFDVKAGQQVQRGDKLGAAGATGRVTGPHLHWGMRVNGLLVDPHQMLTVYNSLFGSS
jgi:murein DD-endopeptidase MepM/ murein hydrolase activator NlpD